MRWTGPDGYWVSDDRSLVDVARVHRWLSSESYWAEGRSFDLVARSVRESLTLGLVRTRRRTGRRVSLGHRLRHLRLAVRRLRRSRRPGSGLGTFLVETAMAHPEVGISGCRSSGPATPTSSTGDSASQPLASPERWMERRR